MPHSYLKKDDMTVKDVFQKVLMIIKSGKVKPKHENKKYSKLILFSGGLNFFTRTIFSKSEAEEFAKVAIEEGVDPDKILIESKSKNTGENIQFSKILLNELIRSLNEDLDVESIMKKVHNFVKEQFGIQY
jgi:hypothetical protein